MKECATKDSYVYNKYEDVLRKLKANIVVMLNAFHAADGGSMMKALKREEVEVSIRKFLNDEDDLDTEWQMNMLASVINDISNDADEQKVVSGG